MLAGLCCFSQIVSVTVLSLSGWRFSSTGRLMETSSWLLFTQCLTWVLPEICCYYFLFCFLPSDKKRLLLTTPQDSFMKPLMMFFSYLFNFLWKKLAHLGPVSKSCIFILVLLLVFQLAVPKIRSKALAGVFSVSVQEQKTNFKLVQMCFYIIIQRLILLIIMTYT